jgi:hypothetical protein
MLRHRRAELSRSESSKSCQSIFYKYPTFSLIHHSHLTAFPFSRPFHSLFLCHTPSNHFISSPSIKPPLHKTTHFPTQSQCNPIKISTLVSPTANLLPFISPCSINITQPHHITSHTRRHCIRFQTLFWKELIPLYGKERKGREKGKDWKRVRLFHICAAGLCSAVYVNTTNIYVGYCLKICVRC